MASDSEQKLSRIEQWRKKTADEKKAKNKAYYENNKKQIIRKNLEYRQSRKSSTSTSQRRSTRHNKKKLKKATKNEARFKQNKDTLEKDEKRKALQRERAKRYRERIKTSQTSTGNEDGSNSREEENSFPNRMAKKQALEKVKNAMPSTPSKKAKIVLDISSSPRTRKILIKKGALQTPEEEKEVLKAVAQDFSEGLSAIKTDKTNYGRAAYTAAKSLAFEEAVKKSRSRKTVSKLFLLDRRSISTSIEKRMKTLKGEESCWLAKNGKHAVMLYPRKPKNWFMTFGHTWLVGQLEIKTMSCKNAFNQKFQLSTLSMSWN